MIKKVKYLYDYLLEVTFYDHTTRVIDLERYFTTSAFPLVRKFAPLELFRQFRLDPTIGTLCWGDNECDVDPFMVYEGAYDAQPEFA